MSCHARGHWHFQPTFYHECYGFERAFFTLRCFLPYTPSFCFQGLPRWGSSPSKVACLHADHQDIAAAWLLCRMTAIHKRGILVGSIYVSKASFKVRVPQPWNLSLTGFGLIFFEVRCVSSRLYWRLLRP